jgi:hypothetical protein
LTLVNGGSGKPWTFGQVFRKGDVPSGQQLAGSGTSAFQADVRTRWSDGSVQFAVLSGIGGTLIQLTTAGASSMGTSLSQAQLAAALPPVEIQVGAHTTTLNKLIGTAARHRTVVEGPVMSSWIYREAVSGSNHLVVWADVRYYANGSVEIFPWVENGYLLVPNPTNAVVSCVVRIDGQPRFSTTIDVKHHTRVPLVNGTKFSYWVGADPDIVPKHDGAYFMATKVVPNYGWLSPSEAALAALQQSYTPNSLAGISTAMGAAGGSGSVISTPGIFYLGTGDPRAYRATLVRGLSSGSWSVHHRDETTHQFVSMTKYPQISAGWGGTPTVPEGTGGANGTVALTHLPGLSFLPFLLTGRTWFWEESAFWMTYAQLGNSSQRRFGGDGVIDTSEGFANRGAAWVMRSLVESAFGCPQDEPLRAEWVSYLNNNARFYRTKYVDGGQYRNVDFGKSWVSPHGVLGEYSSMSDSLYPPPVPRNSWWGAPWMNAFSLQVWGWASDMDLPMSTEGRDNWIAVRNHGYKQPIQRAGDGSPGTYNWRRFTVYALPVGEDAKGLPVDRWFTSGEIYREYLAGNGLDDLPATEGLTLKAHGSAEDISLGTESAIFYLGVHMSALAMAKEQGVPGAVDAWRRITAASNFKAISSFWNNDPEHSFVPR